MNNIAFFGFSRSISGPPKSRPKIEKPPKKIKPVPSISIVQSFWVKIKIWWNIKPVPTKENADRAKGYREKL